MAKYYSCWLWYYKLYWKLWISIWIISCLSKITRSMLCCNY
ncbi:unnamed protein product [Schistosoma curassoni]|uniref:Uncharacterized protein n=1 Tax=Schistosoma curassoni TaxID=6186 RepID=A0A183JU69_9TREM|nr:unnamed protein product [Schistosoma curassoni]